MEALHPLHLLRKERPVAEKQEETGEAFFFRSQKIIGNFAKK
jgi:hypothetical protein